MERIEIDPNPETKETGIISGYPEQPYKLRIATKPMAASFGIVSTWGNGQKNVGFVMAGGTTEQFENAMRLQKLKNKALGWVDGYFIHATAGTIVKP